MQESDKREIGARDNHAQGGSTPVKPEDLKQGGRLEDLTVGLSKAETGALIRLARTGQLTDDTVGQAKALAESQHDKDKDGNLIVKPGQLLVISGRYDVEVPVASALADVATSGKQELDQGRVAKAFKAVCEALGKNEQTIEHLKDYFDRLPPDRQVKLVEVVGELVEIAADYDVTLRPVVRLFNHYDEVSAVRRAVEQCADIAQAQSGDRELTTGTVINRFLGALQNAESHGSSKVQAEQLLDDGEYAAIVAFGRRRGLAD